MARTTVTENSPRVWAIALCIMAGGAVVAVGPFVLIFGAVIFG